jgi:membrane protein required for colicin V production
MGSSAAAAAELPPVINWLDICIFAVMLASAVFAYFRGLTQEVLSIVGWVGAIFATIYGFPLVQPYARQFIDYAIVADFAAGIVLFVVSLAILSLFTRMISKRIRESALNAVDRSLGFLFGLLRGALIVLVAYLAFDFIYPMKEQPNFIKEARAMALVKPGAAMLARLIPEGFSSKDADEKGAKAGKPGAGKKTSEPPPGTPAGKRRVVQDLPMPQPKGQKDGDVVGYGDKERRDMQRLHDSIKDR